MPRSRSEQPDASSEAPIDIAVRLLELQQRVAAFGALYDEEITGLTEELSRLKAEFVRYYRTQAASESGKASAAKATRTNGGVEPSKPSRRATRRRPEQPLEQPPEQPLDGSSPQDA